MEAAIITIGDELLIGQVIDTNSAWLATQLNQLGFTVKARLSVGDKMSEIRDAIYYATELAPVIITTGGLGPTSDDRTREVLCELFESEMHQDDEVLGHIQQMFVKRGYKLTEMDVRQALVPDRAKVLFNSIGTAPGLYFEDGSVHIFVMPGVPFEMKEMFSNEVVPHLKKMCGQQIYVHENLVVSGIGESALSDLIKPWEQALPSDVSLAYLPSPGLIRLRLSYMSGNEQRGREKLKRIFAALQPQLKPYFVSDRDEKMAETLLREFIAAGKTLSTAESCTGGFIAHQITSVSGSSNAFKGSVVAYANEIKQQVLGVSQTVLEQHGAVSAETVLAMAEGARRLMNSDFSIAVSGIAGPGGGSDEKPVGLVYVAVASDKGSEFREFRFGNLREVNISRSAMMAMFMCLQKFRKEL